jgi:hypothetical protein
MTTELQVANVIWMGIALIALWAVCRFFVIPAIRDTLRHRLFAIRREMFLFMAEGGVSPDHPAYGSVRTFINVAIRYADGLSLARSLIGFTVAGKFGKERVKEVERLIATLPEPARTRISSFRQRAAMAIGLYASIRSPLAWVLVFPAIVATVVFVIISILRSAWAKTRTDALAALTKKVEQETQILVCIEEEQKAAA